MTEPESIPPSPEQRYLAYLAEGSFMIQRSRIDGRYVFYPRVAAPGTGEELDWVQATGTGTVYATTVVRQRAPAADYNVVLVDLDEGVRMMSRVEGIPPGSVRVGQRVRARIRHDGPEPAVVFDPAMEGGDA